VSEKHTHCQQKQKADREQTDLKLACNSGTKHPKLGIYIVDNGNMELLSLNLTFIQKALPNKNILQDCRNKLVPNTCENLKLGTSYLQKKLDMEARSHNEALSLSRKIKCVNPLMIQSPRVNPTGITLRSVWL